MDQLLKKISRNGFRIVLAVSVASFLVAFSYAWHFKIQPSVDARAYDQISWQIAQGRGYDQDSSIGRPGPGYEYFLAGIFKLFGHHYQIVWIIQALLLSLSCLLVYDLARRATGSLWHPLIGIIAAIFVGFSPDLILSASLLMTEILSVFLMVATLWVLFICQEKKNPGLLVASGLILGALILTRGNAIFLSIPIGIWLIATKRYRDCLIIGLTVFLVLTPWTIRNYKVYGIIKPVNGSAGLLYVGNRPGATGELDLNYQQPSGYDFSKMNQLQADTALGEAGRKYILDHPLDFLRLTAIKATIYGSFARPFAFWPHLQGVAKKITIFASSLYAALTFLGGVTGLMVWWQRLKSKKESPEKFLLFLSLAIALPLSVIWLVVETRYRFPIYPLLAIGLGVGLYSYIANGRELAKRWRPILFTTIIMLGITAFDVISNFARIKSKF